MTSQPLCNGQPGLAGTDDQHVDVPRRILSGSQAGSLGFRCTTAVPAGRDASGTGLILLPSG